MPVFSTAIRWFLGGSRRTRRGRGGRRSFVSGRTRRSEIDDALEYVDIAQASRTFDRISAQATSRLRRTVPVRTGLMRSKVSNQGNSLKAVIFSDAQNSKGVEYAQFVERYARALRDTEEFANQLIQSGLVRVESYDGVASDYLPASAFIDVRIEETRLVLELTL